MCKHKEVILSPQLHPFLYNLGAWNWEAEKKISFLKPVILFVQTEIMHYYLGVKILRIYVFFLITGLKTHQIYRRYL